MSLGVYVDGFCVLLGNQIHVVLDVVANCEMVLINFIHKEFVT